MAVRRPRIKAAALLTTKRKPRDVKTESSTKGTNDAESSDLPKPTKNYDNNTQNLSTFNNEVQKVTEDTSGEERQYSEQASETPLFEPKEDGGECSVKDQETKEKNENGGTVNRLLTSSNNDVEPQKTNKSSGDSASSNLKTENSFKCPASIENSRGHSQNISNVGVDDVFYTDMEEITLQSDMQKNTGDHPTAYTKQQARQRIRPVPLLQRRNSLVGVTNPTQGQADDNATSTDIQTPQATQTSETETTDPTPNQKMYPVTQRRERHYSASMVQSPLTSNSSTGQHHYTPHKFTPAMGLGRIRTESNCSAFSDSFVTPSKIRKIDEHNNRSNHRKDFTCRIVNGNLDKSSLKMFDLIYYNPTTNPMEKRNSISTVKKESTIDEIETKITPTDSKEEITDGKNNAMPVPQLKLNANGDLILDEKTLEIETTAEQEARKVLANSSLIFLDENTGMNGFYKRQKRTKEWPPEETIKFYRCLQTVGTDFSLMCQLFPKRTRRDLKLKFKREERSNLALINKALLYPKLFNIDDLKTQLETEEREREETLQRWKEIQKKEAKTIKKIKINQSVAARTLKHGEEVYENENVVKRKLSRRSKTTEKKKSDSTKKAKTTQQTHSSPHDDNVDAQSNTQIITTDHKKLPIKPRDDVPVMTVAQTSAKTATSNTKTIPVKLEVVQVFDHTVKCEHETNILLNSQISSNENGAESLEIPQAEERYINYTTNPNSETLNESNEETTTNQDIVKSDAKAEIEVKTYVDLDDGTVNTFEEGDDDLTMMEVMPATPASVSQREIDECDMEQILMDLAAGSLVLVSTLDPDNADQVINEIYMMDKITGELCEKPLDIPESIVQSVLSVMS